MRKEGFLPKGLHFGKGKNYGDKNPEAKGEIESARIESEDVFLAHGAYVSHAGKRFEDLARSYGFSDAQISGLTDMQRNFWISLTFAGPGGAAWDSGLRGYGVMTVLGYMRDHGLQLSDVEAILDTKPFSSKRRTTIAVRTAAIISGLEHLMREYFEMRAKGKREVLEHGSEYEIMSAY